MLEHRSVCKYSVARVLRSENNSDAEIKFLLHISHVIGPLLARKNVLTSFVYPEGKLN
ncbi:hypothetical protein Scep_009281 [Stephania cephalantha]|uniref:Uncharacterized protein n=1 Tax=Stephania cephalantha TaxID=152367 RepID=A0AAP0PG43_9MAGN